MGISSAVYFYWYAFFKAIWLRVTQRKSLGAAANLSIASLAGVVNVFLTTPYWVVNTRMALQHKQGAASAAQDHYTSISDAFIKIWKREGLAGLYTGLMAALILVSNPSIQFAMYEQMTRYLLRIRTVQRTLSAGLAAPAVSAAAAAAASSVQAAVKREPTVRLTAYEFFVLGAIAKTVATLCTYPYQVCVGPMKAGGIAVRSGSRCIE